jgi:hypothetical protein
MPRKQRSPENRQRPDKSKGNLGQKEAAARFRSTFIASPTTSQPMEVYMRKVIIGTLRSCLSVR